MGGGNNIDIAAVYQLLTRVAETQGEHTRTPDAHTRQLEDRVRRIEHHLNLTPAP
jgi:hypothetical protein